MRNPNYQGSPPPPYCHHEFEATRHLNETAHHINRRADVIAEGHTTAELDPDFEEHGLISTGGMSSGKF